MPLTPQFVREVTTYNGTAPADQVPIPVPTGGIGPAATLVIAMLRNIDGSTVTSVTDPIGTAYTVLANLDVPSPQGPLSLAVAVGRLAEPLAKNDMFTVTASDAFFSYWQVKILEFRDLDDTTALVVDTATGTDAVFPATVPADDPTSVTADDSGTLIVGIHSSSVDPNTFTATFGFAARGVTLGALPSGGIAGLYAESRTTTGAGTVSSGPGLQFTAYWGSIVVALRGGDDTPPTVAPVCVWPPVITGTARVGETLTCSNGFWSGQATVFAFQWLRDGEPITGATSGTYLLDERDGTRAIKCVVTASNIIGGTDVSSNEVFPPSGPAPDTLLLAQGEAWMGRPVRYAEDDGWR